MLWDAFWFVLVGFLAYLVGGGTFFLWASIAVGVVLTITLLVKLFTPKAG